MGGATLAALMSQTGIDLRTVVAIEGVSYVLTDAATSELSAVATSWAAAQVYGAYGGLRVTYALDQRLEPWEPFDSSASRVTLTVTNAPSNVGDASDAVGSMMFKREPTTSSPLMVDLDPNTASIVVKRSDDLAPDDVIHIGCEAILADANDTGTETLNASERGRWHPFETESGAGLGRSHYVTASVPGVDLSSMPATLVTNEPIEWAGRWVGVWLHRIVDGVLDVKAQAHLVFAGKITDVVDTESGDTVIHASDVRQVIKNTAIHRRPWRATLKDGVWLRAGTRFKAKHFRQSPPVFGDADDLVVVPSGAATTNEIDEGQYTGGQLESAINAWLAEEFNAARIYFKMVFTYDDLLDGERRSSLKVSDNASTTLRTWELNTTSPAIRKFLGWDAGGLSGQGSAAQSVSYSDAEPLRILPLENGGGFDMTLQIDNVSGSFVDQSALMVGGFDAPGVIRVGNAFLLCETPSVTNGQGTVVVRVIVNGLLGLDSITDWADVAVAWNEDGRVEIQQILVLEGKFKTLVLAMLAGSGGSNWPDYELLPETCSAAIPYSLMGPDLEAEIAACPGADDVMRVRVDKPTSLAELFDASFILRRVQFVWRQGRLALRGFATPTSTATMTIGTDDRAAPVSTRDSQRSVTRQSEEWVRNLITVRSNLDARTGDYSDETTIEISGSVTNYGARGIDINARNSAKGSGTAGEDVEALLPTFVAPLSFLSTPATIITIPIGLTLFETATPGEVCLFSDDFARDPSTGRRGISGKPALIVASKIYGYGGASGDAVGELDLMLFPRLSLAPYSPCAQVDHTAANAGYDAGTKTLTLKGHEHSDTTWPVDATHFDDGDEVTVIEIDPATAAAPLLWTDTVSDVTGSAMKLTTGLAGWDTSKKYRVVSMAYSAAVATQQTDAYQADDSDGLIENLRAPYSLAFHPAGQTTTWTVASPTELPERPPTAAYGDGAPLDTGHARALARLANNLHNYAAAVQQPDITEECAFGGGGTWEMVEAFPVFFGAGRSWPNQTRKLYVAPTIKAKSGTVSCRVTVSAMMPRSSGPTAVSRDDVVRVAPYVSTTFTTSSATYTTPAPATLSLATMNLGDGPLGGMAWCYVEIGANCSYRGLGALRVGPVEAL